MNLFTGYDKKGDNNYMLLEQGKKDNDMPIDSSWFSYNVAF